MFDPEVEEAQRNWNAGKPKSTMEPSLLPGPETLAN
jgi:hypothetical protein